MKRCLLVLLVAVGCARATTPPVNVVAEPGFGGATIGRLAVMPAAAAPESEIPGEDLDTVTELLVQAASRHGAWEVIDPERARAVLSAETAPSAGPARAGLVAEKTAADASLGVIVSRFRERVGSDYGVAEPASVALELVLVPRGAAQPAWRAEYSFTQEPLTYNLWNFWGVLRGGPRWLTAAELARIGVDEAVSRLAAGR